MSEKENNFESLRRLLALKRHEVPSPGYFNSFSAQVIHRIRAGEAKAPTSASEWFMKFLQNFQAKPAFAGAFASALCLLLVLGVVFSERPDYSAPQPLLTQATESSAPLTAVSSTPLSQASDQTMLASGSTNPVLNLQPSLQPVASLFGQRNPFAEQVSFSQPFGN
jgi:hypothetical protein